MWYCGYFTGICRNTRAPFQHRNVHWIQSEWSVACRRTVPFQLMTVPYLPGGGGPLSILSQSRCRCPTCSWRRQATSRYAVPHGSATGCAATTKGALRTSESLQQCSKLTREFLRKNKNVKIMHSSKGSPYLNAMEECWHQRKHVLLISEYYRTFQDMCRAVSLYYRTVRFKLDLRKFASRKYETLRTNF